MIKYYPGEAIGKKRGLLWEMRSDLIKEKGQGPLLTSGGKISLP